MRQMTNKWTPWVGLAEYSRVLLRKMGYIAIMWVAVYFISQPFRVDGSPLMLFAPLLGALAGLTAGWYLAEDAVQDSSMTGVFLWTLLVVTSWIPIGVVEGIMLLVTRWKVGFGGWMVIASAMLLSFAAAVWRSSADD